ncbi:MAG: hypothetical protein WCM76_07835 [Bacteroidota bacterium]
MHLSKTDIKQIKYELRPGIIFSIIVLFFGGLFNVLFFTSENYNSRILFIVVADVVIMCSSLLVFYAMNRKYIKDLRAGTKQSKTGTVENKEEEISYEAGSGNLHIPILGDIFPKIWGQKMKENTKFFLIISNRKYEVEKEFYDKVNNGDLLEIYFSEYSEILLGLEMKKCLSASGGKNNKNN